MKINFDDSFSPNYKNLEMAARNQVPRRLPLYEHLISERFMERVLGCEFTGLDRGNYEDKLEYFRNYCRFFLEMGYDTVSFECCIGPSMPGSGSLGSHVPGVIRDMDDFRKYPWDEIPDMYFEKNTDMFKALRETLPEGMKAVGGAGNGIFECVQDVTGYMDLCYIRADDFELYGKLFERVGKTNLAIWSRLLERFGDIFCVARFGDDLGFKTNSLIPDSDIREFVIPAYKPIVELAHGYGKPLLLHSCGNIFNVFDDIIDETGIDAKHSNEDQIAPFAEWVERYGDRIGNFGGIDTDALCRCSEKEIKEYILDVLEQVDGKGGIAFGSGNSIPDYVPEAGYLAMIETVREYRNR